MLVYRLEHQITGKGPFEHLNSKGERSNLALHLSFHKDPNDFEEFTNWCEVNGFDTKKLPHNYLFAWSSKEQVNENIGSSADIKKYGFRKFIYDVTDFILLPDGQVVFNLYGSTKLSVFK